MFEAVFKRTQHTACLWTLTRITGSDAATPEWPPVTTTAEIMGPTVTEVVQRFDFVGRIPEGLFGPADQTTVSLPARSLSGC